MRERAKARVTNEEYNEVRGLRETSDVGLIGLSALLGCGESSISVDSGKERLVKDLASHNFHKPPVPTRPLYKHRNQGQKDCSQPPTPNQSAVDRIPEASWPLPWKAE